MISSLDVWFVEAVGTLGSLMILISMCYKSTSIKNNFYMRIWNLVGSVLFVFYGVFLHAYSTIVLNAIMVVIHIYYMIKLSKENTDVE